MIYLLLFLFFILLRKSEIQSKKSFKKLNILNFIPFPNKNLITKRIEKEILNSSLKKNEDNIIICKEKRNISNLSNISKSSKEIKKKSVLNNLENYGCENGMKNFKNDKQDIVKQDENIISENNNVIGKKKKKKKSYKKVQNIMPTNDIKDLKKDIKLFFFKKRIIYITDEINKKTADEIISQLLYLDNLNHDDIKIYINSPGGSINEGLAILDIFNYIKSDIQTISFGLVASMASVILASGKKGKRKSLPNCRIMIHQPLGNAFGHPHDIEIQTKEILYLKSLLYNYLSRFTNQSIETIEKHSDRDFYMNALEAKNYGIIDEIIETKLPHPYFNEI
ncbi:ATP-dependent Clp protease proteolytic subunit, putative [Plasmodium gallinaceum]|uniref:ATP-dependent Clp protease proteolytic subunit n=1 Tax=Plasmodium gallinaceum TaxID=5849 RepID=A0A1J1GSN2_PLAGA|nr:ATP-dependent Clp protease proteolytic subunit, putative [Plasmodium gallinaceum]CRG95302.1 ATP-dependent Clp protease proteolytic subunit, putative [Plasmodium gallinaceum]